MKSRRKGSGIFKISCIMLLVSVLVLFAGCKKKMTLHDYLDLGDKYLTEANYEEAIIAFTKAMEIDPKQAAAYEKRAEVYTARIQASGVDDASRWTDELRGFYVSGEADYLKAIELELKTAGNYEKLAELYLLAGETEKAVNILKKGYEETGDEALDKRRQEIEASQITSTVDPSVYNGSMTVEMYGAVDGYMGKDIYSYDDKGRMISSIWYKGDGSVIDTNSWTYDDKAGKTEAYITEVYYEGIEEQEGKQNGEKNIADNGQEQWVSKNEISGCKDQAWYYFTMGYGWDDAVDKLEHIFLIDPTRPVLDDRIELTDSQVAEEHYATYEYDSLGRVSAIYSYTSGGEETGYCIVTYSSGE